jgi:hypothetical protein
MKHCRVFCSLYSIKLIAILVTLTILGSQHQYEVPSITKAYTLQSFICIFLSCLLGNHACNWFILLCFSTSEIAFSIVFLINNMWIAWVALCFTVFVMQYALFHCIRSNHRSENSNGNNDHFIQQED